MKAGTGPGLELPANGAGKVLVLAVLMGVVGALVASVFLAVMSVGQEFVWQQLPESMGWAEVPAWYSLAFMLVGAALVAVAFRLPGHTGGMPLTGLHFDTGPRQVGSVLLAALGTLIFALPLGPEAPLIACGTAAAALLTRRAEDDARKLAMLLGGAAAIGAIFGNPFITAFMFLEFAALGMLPSIALVPVLIALGTGYLLQTGLGSFSGLPKHELAGLALPKVERLDPVDLLYAAIVALVVGLLVVLARTVGWRVAVVAQRRRLVVLFAATVLIWAAAMAVVAWTDLPATMVLFSGEEGMQQVISASSLGAVVLVVLLRTATYGLAISSGFRGGPTFPAVFLGVAAGVGMALIVGQSHLSPMVVAGMAAATAAVLRVPFTAGILAVLLASSAGPTVAPVAIVGAVVGWLVRVAWDRRVPVPKEFDHPLPAPAAPQPA